MLDLINARPEIFNNYYDETFAQKLPQLCNQWFESPFCVMVGIFKDDILIGAAIALESEYTPSWTWAYWISREKNLFNIFTDKDFLTALKQGDELLFNEMENVRHLNRFFVHFAYGLKSSGIKITGIDDRLLSIMKRHNFRISRYHIITDCIIPAGTMAKYPYQCAIHGSRPWSIDTEIRLGVLIQ